MVTTKCHLSEPSVACLQELIQANIDSRDGFSEAAANLRESASLATTFSRLARQRETHVAELQDLVACNEALPHHTGSFSAVAHRVWMDVRAVFGGGDRALLDEAEHGENRLLRHYRTTINELQDSECIDLLRRQFANIQTAHDKIHALRAQAVT